MDNGLEKLNIQWYPGHMTKAGRMISANVANVDAVCEILDARIPTASRNPDIDSLAAGKPRLVLLNRSDLADPSASALWKAHFKAQGMAVLETDCKSGKGVGAFSGAVRSLLKPLLEIVANEQYSRHSVDKTAIKIAKLGNDAGIIGAAMLSL